MSDVWLQRINRGLEKLFNVKGGPTLVDINPALQMVLPVQSGVEELYLQGWQRFGVTGTTSPVAAQTGAWQMRNPTGSGVLAVIERIGIKTGAATLSNIHVTSVSTLGGSDLGTILTPFKLDARVAPSSSVIPSMSSNAADLNNWLTTATLNGLETVLFGQDIFESILLLPNDALRIVDQTVNEALTVNMVWRERVMETSESS